MFKIIQKSFLLKTCCEDSLQAKYDQDLSTRIWFIALLKLKLWKTVVELFRKQ